MAVMDILVRATDNASGVLQGVEGQIEGVASAGETAARTISQKMQDVGTSMQGVGKTLTTRVTLPIAGLGALAFRSAAEFQDAMGAAEQIFGGMGDEMATWADTLPGMFGIAQDQALGFANVMGSLLKNIGGLSEEAAAQQSQTLVKLAGDLTAMFGGTTEDAVRALTGALKGQTQMLDNYGIAGDEATIKTKALEEGIWDGTGAMTAAQKQAAILAVIMEQTAAAQGQASREASGASGQMRTLTTDFKNLSSDLGSNLLPIGTKVLGFFNNILSVFTSMSPTMQTVILSVAGLAAALGPLLIVTGKVITAVTQITTAITKVGPALTKLSSLVMSPTMFWVVIAAAVVALVILIVQNWDKITEFLRKVWTTISETAANIWNGIKDFFSNLWESISRTVSTVWGSILDFFRGLPQKAIAALGGFATTVFSWIVENHPIAILFRKVKEVWPQVSEWFRGIPQKIIGALGNMKNLLFNVGKDILNGLWNGLKDVWNNVTGWVSGLGQKIADLKGPADVDRVLLTDNGSLIMGGLLKGMQEEWPRVENYLKSRSAALQGSVSMSGGAGFSSGRGQDLASLLSQQNDLLRRILERTGFYIDGRDLADAVGGPLVNEIRARTGL